MKMYQNWTFRRIEIISQTKKTERNLSIDKSDSIKYRLLINIDESLEKVKQSAVTITVHLYSYN